MRPLCILTWVILLVFGDIISSELQTVYSWKYVDYLWKSRAQKQEYINDGRYNYKSVIPFDVDVSKDGRVFVTTLRFDGTPATLSTISGRQFSSDPLLKPYPSWEANENRDCSGISNVYRIAIDKCNTLWVVDTGIENENQTCPAQLLAYDLWTDRLIKRIEIPREFSHNSETNQGLLVNIAVLDDHCPGDVKVFISDARGFALVVWNGEELFRIEHPIFDALESYENITVAGEPFSLADGLLGIAISPRLRYYPRLLFMRSFASLGLYYAKIDDILNYKKTSNLTIYGSDNVLPSQASVMGFTSLGTLLLSMLAETAIDCWNINTPLETQNFNTVLVDERRLQVAGGLKIKRGWRNKEIVWMFSDRFQKVPTQSYNFSEINFRVLRIPVDELILRTHCKVSRATK